MEQFSAMQLPSVNKCWAPKGFRLNRAIGNVDQSAFQVSTGAVKNGLGQRAQRRMSGDLKGARKTMQWRAPICFVGCFQAEAL